MRSAASTFLPPPPRAVHRKFGSGCGLWFARIFILPHTVAGVLIISIALAHLYVQNWGTPVSATVDNLTTRTGRRGKPTYRMVYHYELKGLRFNDADNVRLQVYGSSNIGEVFPGRAQVLFSHAFFQSSAKSIGNDNWILLIFSLFWNGFVLLFNYALWIVPLRLRRLVELGLAVPGIVTGTSQQSGRSRSYRVSYRFSTQHCQEYTGRRLIGRAAYELIQKDQSITVLYDPNDPNRNLLYEFCNYEIEGPLRS